MCVDGVEMPADPDKAVEKLQAETEELARDLKRAAAEVERAGRALLDIGRKVSELPPKRTKKTDADNVL